jgi:Transposase DNA-binding
MIPIDELVWSQQLFGGSDLGDARRTARLVDVAARMAKQAGSSLAKSCDGDQAALLGSYRLMRNEAVKPEAVRASGFARVAELAQAPELLLAASRHHQRQLPPCGGGWVGSDGWQAGS